MDISCVISRSTPWGFVRVTDQGATRCVHLCERSQSRLVIKNAHEQRTPNLINGPRKRAPLGSQGNRHGRDSGGVKSPAMTELPRCLIPFDRREALTLQQVAGIAAPAQRRSDGSVRQKGLVVGSAGAGAYLMGNRSEQRVGNYFGRAGLILGRGTSRSTRPEICPAISGASDECRARADAMARALAPRRPQTCWVPVYSPSVSGHRSASIRQRARSH